MSAMAHAKFKYFSTYRAGYTRKMPPNPRTYVAVLKIVAYRAANKEDVQADLMDQQALRACGLYKFWCLGNLRAKPRLLQLLVDYWDPESETFKIDGMSLSIEVEDIYFITGLSR